MKKQPYISVPSLLGNVQFLKQLRFESEIASALNGGHAPFYLNEAKKARLIHDINLLESGERKETVFHQYISLN